MTRDELTEALGSLYVAYEGAGEPTEEDEARREQVRDFINDLNGIAGVELLDHAYYEMFHSPTAPHGTGDADADAEAYHRLLHDKIGVVDD